MFKEDHKIPQIYLDPTMNQVAKAILRHFTSVSLLSPLRSPPNMTRLREEVSYTTINLSKIQTLCLSGNNTK